MATRFTVMRLVVSCMLAGAMLAACGGSQMSGSSLGTTPQAAGAPNSQHSGMMPADDGCGDTLGGLHHADDGHGCCGGDIKGGLHQADDGHGCCGDGDGGSWRGGAGLRSNDDEHHCHNKNITVTPRKIFFTPSNPGPVTVTVKTRQDGTVTEFDTCGGASGVATVIQQGTSDKWTVTAGSQTGSCKALFILKDSNGNKIGQAVLHITNFL